MANKKVLVGVQDANGNMVPQPWVASDTVTDQDGNVLYRAGNAPPSILNSAVGSGSGTILNYTWSTSASYLEIWVGHGIQSTGLASGHYIFNCSTGVIRGGTQGTNTSFGGGSALALNKTAAGGDKLGISLGLQSVQILSVSVGGRNIQISSAGGTGVAMIIEHE